MALDSIFNYEMCGLDRSSKGAWVSTFTYGELKRWVGRPATDKFGLPVGLIADIYVDATTGYPEWLAIDTGLVGARLSFAPLVGASEDGENVNLAYEKSHIKDSPSIETGGRLNEDEEDRLYRHYGLVYPRTRMRSQSQPDVGAIDLRTRRGGDSDPRTVSDNESQTK